MACLWACDGSNVDRLVAAGHPATTIDALCHPRLAFDRGSRRFDQLLAGENWIEL